MGSGVATKNRFLGVTETRVALNKRYGYRKLGNFILKTIAVKITKTK